MFKNFFVATIMTASVISTLPAVAHADGKIALVNLQRALNDVDEGKKIKATLKKDFDLKNAEIQKMKTDIESTSKNLESQKMVLSQDAVKTKSQEIQTKFMDLQNKAATYEQDLKKKEAESAKKILDKLQLIVGSLAQKNGYSLVLENSANIVLYSKDTVDITNDVISAYNSGK